jgi:signal transduction histidine kinase
MERTEQLLAFLYRIPVAVVELNGSGEIGLMNPTAAQYLLPLTGGKPPKNLFSLLEPFLPQIRERVEAFAEPSGLVIGEQRLIIADRHYSLDLRKVDEGLYMAAISDVTEAFQREQRVQEAVAQEAEQRGRSEIAAGVLHDIGNAVTALGTTVARALGDLDWPELSSISKLREFLLQRREGIESALGAEKSELLFDLLLELSRALEERREELHGSLDEMAGTLTHISEILTIQRSYTSERPEILGRRVDLRRVLDDAVEMQAVSLANRRIKVERRYPEESLVVKGDRTKLVRVAMNLLRNTAEAFDRELTEGKDRRIRLSAGREGSRVTVLIEDNGPGFTPPDRPSDGRGGSWSHGRRDGRSDDLSDDRAESRSDGRAGSRSHGRRDDLSDGQAESRSHGRSNDLSDDRAESLSGASAKGAAGGLGLQAVARLIEAHGGKLERGESELGGALVSFWLPLEKENNDG